ncbi:unnamed protein product [Parnassius apollo]|uniref:(apollo) hypothetical protein n=1 Tax=Parnassius apollo TaxID=110799 RepID=A0A8S3Y8T2_PARAO|nr:unnamed protein product [Parnassius apollo]
MSDLLEEHINYESIQILGKRGRNTSPLDLHIEQKKARGCEQEGDWEEVKSRKEKSKEIRGSIEICITSKEKFPKQFALAKLFKNQNLNTVRVKIIVELYREKDADLLIQCDHLVELGWRFQRPFEVGLSYGVIKNIELDLSEKELLESISCSIEVANVKRLKRRKQGDGESGWTESESVRVGFIGSTLLSYLCTYDMQVKVEPYLFPVTQCSRCWRFGHTLRMCPSKRIYCPKCGGKHANCETTIFKCLNCTKNHMALNRQCPKYIKEKKLREIMAEFNVSYRKAMAMYVPPETPTYVPTQSPMPRLDETLKKADWVKYRQVIEEECAHFEISSNPQEAYDDFITFLFKAAEASIPFIKICRNPKANFIPKPYWTPDLSHAVAERRLELKTFRQNPTPANLNSLREKTRKAQKLIRNAKSKVWWEFCTSLNEISSASEMWRKIQWLKGYRSVKPQIEKSIAESLLCNLTPDYVNQPYPGYTSQNPKLETEISRSELYKCLKSKDMCPGADDISYSMLLNLPIVGQNVLLNLYNIFFTQSFAPYQWRHVRIIPIPKSGRNTSCTSSLKPISLISCLSKVFHAIINNRIEWSIENKKTTF